MYYVFTHYATEPNKLKEPSTEQIHNSYHILVKLYSILFLNILSKDDYIETTYPWKGIIYPE